VALERLQRQPEVRDEASCEERAGAIASELTQHMGRLLCNRQVWASGHGEA
jgi:hypothetical protein